MKELFAGFLSVSLSGSIVVCMILLLRLVFKRAPKALICGLWLAVILRMLIPFQIEAAWSLRPSTPFVTGEDTHILTDPVAIPEENVPSFLPQVPLEGTKAVVVDYLMIAGAIWAIGVFGMVLYTVISYLRLKRRVREAVLKEENVFLCGNLDTAFLLGYFRPRIYFPAGIEAEDAELVIAHERAHWKRGDNWLKLIGFVCLSLHWFNPLMWVAYILLCKDIEGACDEHVVKNMEPEKRRSYSNALLSCGKKTTAVAACPVAFGEISIRQRILNVLNYRKPTVWICIVLVLVIALLLVFFLVDPMQKHPPYYEELMDLIGQPMDRVCAELGISEDALEGEAAVGFYETPITVEYEGVSLRLRLDFSRHNSLLSSFAYYALYDDEQKAAEDAEKLAKHAWRAFGKGYQWEENDEPKRLRDTSKDDILAKMEDKKATLLWDHWDLTKDACKAIKTYLNQIEISSVWQEMYGDMAKRYNVSPHFFLTFTVDRNTFDDTVFIIWEYETGWQPGHYSTKVTSDYS